MTRFVRAVAVSAVVLLAGIGRAQDGVGGVLIRGRILPVDAPPIEDGAVLVRGHTIVAVGPWTGEVPAGTRVITAPGVTITPGLIDAASTVGVPPGKSYAEQESEVEPHARVLDELDLEAEGWARLARRGITLVNVGGSPESVIGERAALVRTASAGEDRVLVAAGAVKVTLGPEAWARGQRNHSPGGGGVDHMVRRPTTRMGGVWVVRDAFFRATAGADDPASAVLRDVVQGTVPCRVQARTRGDLETALRLMREAGVKRFALEEATDVRHVLDLVAESGASVIYGPIFDRPRGWRARTGESDDPALDTPSLLEARGLPWCLTAADQEGEDDLVGQVCHAAQWGLEPLVALRAATLAPARILGVVARVGSLTAGKDADLVVWSGDPWEPTTRTRLVLIAGRPVHGDLAHGFDHEETP
jgi:imidazolonepropionase-like amidohydrolase